MYNRITIPKIKTMKCIVLSKVTDKGIYAPPPYIPVMLHQQGEL